MAIGEPVGEFSLTSTGVTVAATPDGGGSNAVNFEGTATGFGTVMGTLTFLSEAPDAKGGQVTWMGQGYLENGDRVGGAGNGVFEEIGNQKWRVRLCIAITDGSVILSDGEVHLDGRSYNGTIQEWT
jgi:hypothetical protein